MELPEGGSGVYLDGVDPLQKLDPTLSKVVNVAGPKSLIHCHLPIVDQVGYQTVTRKIVYRKFG